MKSHVRGLVVTLSVVALLGACSGEGSTEGEVAEGSEALAPSSAPTGWTAQETGSVAFSTPADWSTAPPPSVERSGEGA